MITRENYEIYFIDFFDHNLSKEQELLLLNFLDKNPDLKNEFDSFENLKIQAEEDDECPSFKSLKKQSFISSKNEDDFFIGHLEGDLTKKEEEELKVYLSSNSSSKKTFKRYQAVKLIPPVLEFPRKNKLKKGRIALLSNYRVYLSVAASILFLMWFLPDLNPQPKGQKHLVNTNKLIFLPQKSVESPGAPISTPTDNKLLTNTAGIKHKVKEQLVELSTNLHLDSIQSSSLKLPKNKEVSFEPILLADDIMPLHPVKAPRKNKTRIITPKQLVNRGISNLFLEETKDEVKTTDLLASLGVDITKNKPAEATNKENKASEKDEYFKLKIGDIFEFKRKKKK